MLKEFCTSNMKFIYFSDDNIVVLMCSDNLNASYDTLEITRFYSAQNELCNLTQIKYQ